MSQTKNRGYSLVELVITMAIFSIIMLAIILMMRTSLVSYKDGLFETSMQEEAQIVVNQISDLLVDATFYYAPSSVGDYSFVGPVGSNGKSVDFRIYQDENEIKIYIDDDAFLSQTESLSDRIAYVDADGNSIVGFEIDGLDRRASGDEDSVYDNKAIVKVKIEYQGRTYNAQKEVYFRNGIEDLPGDNTLKPFEVKATTNNTNPDPNTGSLDSIKVVRYKDVNLSAEYNIISATLNGTGASKFKLTQDQAHPMINPAFTGVSDPKEVILSVSDNALSDFTENTKDAYILGTVLNPDGTTKDNVRIDLELEKVDTKQDAKVLRIPYQYDNLGDYGYPTDLDFTGINIYEAIADTENGVDVSCVVKCDGYPAVTINKLVNDDNMKVANEAQIINTNGGFALGIIPNSIETENGVVISIKGGQGSSKECIKSLYNQNKNPSVTFTFKVGDKTLTPVTYALNTAGNSMDTIH